MDLLVSEKIVTTSGVYVAEVGLATHGCTFDFGSLLPKRLKESSKRSCSLLLARPTGPADDATYVGSSVPDVSFAEDNTIIQEIITQSSSEEER